MQLSEFKAWFDGFTEDMDGAPSEKQWERIKGRVKEITGQSVSYPVYIDRYVRQTPYWYGYPYNAALQGVGLNQAVGIGNAQMLASNGSVVSAGSNATAHQGNCGLEPGANVAHAAAAQWSGNLANNQSARDFDSHTAMFALGKADAGNC